MARARSFVFTLNNYTSEEEEVVKAWDCRYLIFGKEIGESLTPHLQGYVSFACQKTMSALKKYSQRAHWEIARGTPKQAADYCCKDGDVFEKGDRPMSDKEKGECGKQSIKERWDLAKAGSFEQLPPECIKTYEYIRRRSYVPTDRTELENIWIQGPSGCGKSRFCRDNYPVFYSKPMSKWWDGYDLEDVVVLDDFDPKHAEYLTYFLKVWADHYAFNAEVKGGMLKIRPKTVVVTSQYRIEDCFVDPESRDAITRRFKVVDMFPEQTKYASVFNR